MLRCVVLHLQGLYIVFQIVIVEAFIHSLVHTVVGHWIIKCLLFIDSPASWTLIVYEFFFSILM